MSTLSSIISDIKFGTSRRDVEVTRLFVDEKWPVARIAAEAGMQVSSIRRLLDRLGVRPITHDMGRPLGSKDQ